MTFQQLYSKTYAGVKVTKPGTKPATNQSKRPTFQTCTPSTLSTTNSYLTSSVFASSFAS